MEREIFKRIQRRKRESKQKTKRHELKQMLSNVKEEIDLLLPGIERLPIA